MVHAQLAGPLTVRASEPVVTTVPAGTPPDDALVARVLGGDGDAFAPLVERHQRPVYALALRMLGNAADAEDATQETFVRAYTRLATYRPGGKFGSWLLAIAAHWCIDHLRRRPVASLEALVEGAGAAGLTVPLAGDSPETLALATERRVEVRGWLARLPASYRRVLVLRYWHELSYAEIGRALDEPVSTVRMRLLRARRAMSRYQSEGHGRATPTRRPRHGAIGLAGD